MRARTSEERGDAASLGALVIVLPRRFPGGRCTAKKRRCDAEGFVPSATAVLRGPSPSARLLGRAGVPFSGGGVGMTGERLGMDGGREEEDGILRVLPERRGGG